MKDTAMLDLQRWSAEVARNPAAPAFLSLARAYRRQGRREAALGVCRRALERQPAHIDGHALLALLYLESGDRERAGEEWNAVLRLEPEHFEAHRGLGFIHLEKGDFETARGHLEQARAMRPDDPAVVDALAMIDGRPSKNEAPVDRAATTPVASVLDPTRLFEPLFADAAFLGALVLDIQGLVIAGTLACGGSDRADMLGAVVGDAVEEAARLTGSVGLGAWRGIQLRTGEAQLQIAPLGGEYTLVVVGSPDVPAGWMARAVERAARLARAYMEVSGE